MKAMISKKSREFVIVFTILISTILTSCVSSSIYIPELYQASPEPGANQGKFTPWGPVAEKINEPSVLKFPDSINRDAVNTDTNTYVGGYKHRMPIRAYENGEKVYIKGQEIYYYFEALQNNTTIYYYFSINMSEDLPINNTALHSRYATNMNRELEDKHELTVYTISSDNHNGNLSWEGVVLEPFLYLNVEIHPDTDPDEGTEVGFMCLEFNDETSLMSALAEEAVHPGGYHLITGLDSNGRTREQNLEINSDTLQKTAKTENAVQKDFDFTVPEGPLPILTVLDFNYEGLSESEVIFITDYLSSSLFDTKAFRIIDRFRRESILDEIKFSLSGCTDESCQIEVGKMLAADKIVVGSIGLLGNQFIINTKLLEVATGETVSTGYGMYESIDDLLSGCRDITYDLTSGYLSGL